jgi:hypothetical protein
MTHTASRKNPPAEALAQAGRESRRAYGLRVPTREQTDALMAEWETDKDATDIALNVQMLYGQQFDTLREEDWRDLARAIQRYGDERAESAIERYQEQGQ